MTWGKPAQSCIDEDDEHENDDTPLLGEPKSKRVTGAEKRILVQPIRPQNPAPQPDHCPEREQNAQSVSKMPMMMRLRR